MVSSKAQTVAEYLASLPADRRRTVAAVRKVIRRHLPRGFQEGTQYGMIGYYIPLSRYPKTYNGQPLQLVGLAAQKNHLALYLMCLYGDSKLERWFAGAFRKAGKKLDMGKSCLRFKQLDDLDLDVIGELIERTSVDDFIVHYERSRAGRPGSASVNANQARARRRPTRQARQPTAREDLSRKA